MWYVATSDLTDNKTVGQILIILALIEVNLKVNYDNGDRILIKIGYFK